MKKKYVFVFFLFGILLFPGTQVHAEESITSFDSAVTLRADATARVVETIRYDFGNTNRHGIFRTIPLTNGDFRIEISDIRVQDEYGKTQSFTITTESSVKTIKIGDPDVLITGPHTYIISYTVSGGVRYFDGYDELYWNTTGTEWPVSVKIASAHITIPSSSERNNLPFACYRGPNGSHTPCERLTRVDGTNWEFGAENLEPNEGLTVAVGFPKGTVAYRVVKKPRFFDAFIWLIPIPFLLTGLLFRKSIGYWNRRRKFYNEHTVITEYDAGETDPLEAAGILRGDVDGKDLSAEIISLAERGYLRIQKVDDEYTFPGTGKPAEDLSTYDKTLFNGIVDKKQTDLIYSFYTTANTIGLMVTESLAIRAYIEPKSKITMGKSSRFSKVFLPWFLAANPGAFVWVLLGPSTGFVFSTTCFLVGLVHLVLNPRPRRLTEKGLQAEHALLGLKEYIAVAEVDRITFHNAPKKTPELFEKLLPYAMIFGLEQEWAKQFETMYTTAPQWYSDSSGAAFSAMAFGSGMHDFTSSMSNALTSAPAGSGSSGGGSSGGGGGGGGGGSW